MERRTIQPRKYDTIEMGGLLPRIDDSLLRPRSLALEDPQTIGEHIANEAFRDIYFASLGRSAITDTEVVASAEASTPEQ